MGKDAGDKGRGESTGPILDLLGSISNNRTVLEGLDFAVGDDGS